MCKKRDSRHPPCQVYTGKVNAKNKTKKTSLRELDHSKANYYVHVRQFFFFFFNALDATSFLPRPETFNSDVCRVELIYEIYIE